MQRGNDERTGNGPPVPVPEEPDSSGLGIGVETEILYGQDSQIQGPFDPDQIDVVTRNPTVNLLILRIREGRLSLAGPKFSSRAGVWTDRQQSRLIESLLLRIPLPTLYVAEDEAANWTVVDGIQRLTAIARFIAPDSIDAPRLGLKGLEYLTAFENVTFDDLSGRLQTRLRETELVVHLIRQGTPEEAKFNIFARINTGGSHMSRQELRHALIPGRARDLLKEWSESIEFTAAIGGNIRDERMAVREMVLRFVAFRLTEPEAYRAQDFDRFLQQAMHEINRLSEAEVVRIREDFNRALLAAEQVFGENAFRKVYRTRSRRQPVNKALFEAQAVNLARLPQDRLELLGRQQETVHQGMLQLVADPEFDGAISRDTGHIAKVRLRFKRIQDLFADALG